MFAESPQAPPPQAVLMQMSLGYTVPFLLRTAAQLRIADHLAGGARTAEQLAAATSTHAPSLYRLLRTLAANGVFSDDQLHRFSLTPLAEPLRSEVPGSVRTSILSITGDLFVVPWSKLLYSVQTGQSAFDKYFGVPFFDHLTRHPDEAALFSCRRRGLRLLFVLTRRGHRWRHRSSPRDGARQPPGAARHLVRSAA